jgi:hypothetical protein
MLFNKKFKKKKKKEKKWWFVPNKPDWGTQSLKPQWWLRLSSHPATTVQLCHGG